MHLLTQMAAGDQELLKQKVHDYAPKHVDPLGVFTQVGRMHEARVEGQKFSSTNYRKHYGIYYTPYAIAKRLTDSLTSEADRLTPDITFLDPCAGHGIFLIAYIDSVAEKLSLSTQDEFQRLINNIYYADIDHAALQLLKENVPIYIKEKYFVDIYMPESNSYTGNSLFELAKDKFQKVDLRKIFDRPEGFSIVATNPPYRLLKANSNKYGADGGENHRSEIKQLVRFLKKQNHYPLSEGTLNLYKLFCEEIVTKLSSQNGLVGLLVPQTLLNDRQSKKIRKEILKYKLDTIYVIPESNAFFGDITQAFCFFGIDKARVSQSIKIISDAKSEKDFTNKAISINKDALNKISSSLPIVAQSETGWKILQKIHAHPKINQLSAIKNLRGELDLTLNKPSITTKKTEWSLLKGSSVGFFNIKQTSEYVLEDFAKNNSKSRYSQQQRLVCQQISNLHSKKRLKFSLVEPSYILGNSCNFIVLEQASPGGPKEPLSLKYLLGILNSNLMEWRFRLTSSNNHVGNYELGSLPIVFPTPKQRAEIENIVDTLLSHPDSSALAALNEYVYNLYNLSHKEVNYINKYDL